MKIQELISKLQEYGLGVQFTEPDHIAVYADEFEPNEIFKKRGVTQAWKYGCTVYRVKEEWAFRGSAPNPTEFYDDLETIYTRIISHHDEYLKRKN